MIRRLTISFALAVALASTTIVAAVASHSPSVNEKGFQVVGEVRLELAGSNKPLKDASKVVVWLKPHDEGQSGQSPTPQKYRMVQRNKMFEPSFLVVPVGSLVDFPNLDPWFHNVFSLYQGKRFDLGLYEAGAHKEIRFDRQGASYIFCNIHPEMAAVIMTVDSGLYGVSDKTGRLLISNVPSGKYLLRVWYDGATPQALSALERTVDIESAGDTLPAISLLVAQHSTEKHKNKYGRDYDLKPGGSDYED
jgi:plastocyanin